MLLGLSFAVLILCGGYATLRPFWFCPGAVQLGLSPVAGLAMLATVATWCALLGVPPPAGGLLVAALGATGAFLIVRDRVLILGAARQVYDQHPVAAITLGLALLLVALISFVAFGDLRAPLSTHDAAFHTEHVERLRHASGWTTWYPAGLAALFAAVLQLLPWVDSAQGTLELDIGLKFLAPLVVFGLGWAIWRNVLMASVGALLIALNFQVPYYAAYWGGWPLELSFLIALGVWLLALVYVEQPSWRLAVLGGLFGGAILLIHGTELYTLAIILPVVLIASWPRIHWATMLRWLPLSAAVMALVAAPYVAILVGWAGQGGAAQVGYEAGENLVSGDLALIAGDQFGTFALFAVGMDMPVRLALLAAGVWFAFRQRQGRSVVVIGVLFSGWAAATTFLNQVVVVRDLYAVTFPWSMHYRLLMVVAVAVALLCAAGAVAIASLIARRPGARRPARVAVAAWLAVATLLLMAFMRATATWVSTLSDDDMAAMAWMRAHVPPGVVVLNDGYADGGIWAPFKAGATILLPRTTDTSERMQVLQNVLELDQPSRAAALACELNVGYVFRGGKPTIWESRHLPSLEQMLQSPGLEVAFRQGDAVVFRVRPSCG